MKQAVQTPDELKLAYVEAQIEQMEAIIRRNEVDIYINENANWQPHQRKAAAAKVETHQESIDELSLAVEVLKRLQSELSK